MDFEELQRNARHGTRARYKSGCSCDDCCWANASYHRALRERKREGTIVIQPRHAAFLPDQASDLDEREDDEPESTYGLDPVSHEQLLAGLRRLRASFAPIPTVPPRRRDAPMRRTASAQRSTY